MISQYSKLQHSSHVGRRLSIYCHSLFYSSDLGDFSIASSQPSHLSQRLYFSMNEYLLFMNSKIAFNLQQQLCNRIRISNPINDDCLYLNKNFDDFLLMCTDDLITFYTIYYFEF